MWREESGMSSSNHPPTRPNASEPTVTFVLYRRQGHIPGGRLRRSRIAAATATLPVALLLAGVLSGCSSHPTDAFSEMAHLDSGQQPSVLPTAVQGVDGDILASSLRLLLTYDDVTYWAGVTGDNEVCFIAHGTVTTSRCVTAQQFGWYGATIERPDSDDVVWLHTEYMVADPAKGWTALAQNIATR
jgi:hypothetical protein